MTRQREGPPDGTRRTLKTRTSSIRKLNNTGEGNSPPRQVQEPTTGSPAAEIVSDLAFRRHVERVHSLGARAITELLAELGSERSIQNIIDEKVERYAAIDPSALAAVGGDDFPPAPLHEVRR